LARARGLILVDTKYEFGVDRDGHVVLADEIHTPDSSRYWYLASYEEQFRKGARPLSFDKDVVRTWVAARCDPYKEEVPEIPRDVILDAAKVYVDVCETITGAFAFPDRSVAPLARIRANLKKYF
jgi:phosphoribosylaminoimidazole-succinocarboxamide synthase